MVVPNYAVVGAWLFVVSCFLSENRFTLYPEALECDAAVTQPDVTTLTSP